MIYLEVDVDIARKMSEEELEILVAKEGIEVESFEAKGTYLTDNFEIITPEFLNIKDIGKLKKQYQKEENQVFKKLINGTGLSRESLRTTLRNYKKYLTTKQILGRLYFVLTSEEIEGLINLKNNHPQCMKLLRHTTIAKIQRILRNYVLNTDIEEYNNLYYQQQKKIDSLFTHIKISSMVFFKIADIPYIKKEIIRRFK